jgi:hypothetical protein
MLVTLILLFCPLGAPSASPACIEKRPFLAEPLNPMSCAIAGQQLGAQYVRLNPDMRFTGYRCAIGNAPPARAA